MTHTIFSRRGRTFALAAAAATLLGALGACNDATTGGTGDGLEDVGDGGAPFVVTGVVLDQRSAEPLAGATVFVGGVGAVTDLAGRFTVEDVEVPYDVAVRASGSPDVRVYRGITVSDPTLLARNETLADHFATVSGTVVLAGTTTDDTVACLLDGPRQLAGSGRAFSSGSSPIAWTMSAGQGNMSARWFGESAIDGTIRCFVERRPSGILTHAFAGARAITLASSGDFDDQEISLAELELASAVADVSAPETISEVTVRALVMLEYGNTNAPPSHVGAPGKYAIAMPLVPGTRTLLHASGTTDLGQIASGVVVPAASMVEADVELLELPAVTSPADGATVHSTDPLAWIGSGHVFLLQVDLPSGVVEVVTAEESAELPDLAPFGLDAPTGAATIRLYEHGPVTTVDEVVDGTTFFELIEQRRDFQFAFGYAHATLD